MIALNRNSPGTHATLGQCKLFTGSLDEVIPLIEQDIRSHDPNLAFWYTMIGR